eukprot:272767-Prymnesium_polylepis.1
MLAGCLERPRLLAAMLDASRLGELLQQPRMQAKMDEFCRETFEDTFYSAPSVFLAQREMPCLVEPMYS